MQNRKPHRQKAPQTGHSIFGTILFSLLAVLAVEILLLTFAVHATRLGPQLNQNAEDILAMQVDNRSRYLQSIFHDAQELTSLSDAINGLTQQLLDEGEISLSTLDSSSDAAYPLLEAAAPELISTLRIKSVTGVFLILNTHDQPDSNGHRRRMPLWHAPRSSAHSRIDVDTVRRSRISAFSSTLLCRTGELDLGEQRCAAELLIFHSDHLLHLGFEIGLLCPRLTGFQKSQSPFLFLEFAGGFVSRPM